MLGIASDLQTIDRALVTWGAEVRPAIARALNRTIERSRGFMVQRIVVATGLPTLIVEPTLKTIRATKDSLTAEVNPRTKAGAKQIPILQLRARQVGQGPRRPGGVSFVFEGASKTIPDAFIAKMRSGHTGVFTRRGRQRLPIIEAKGPSIRTLFERSEAEGLAQAERDLAVFTEDELQQVMRRG